MVSKIAFLFLTVGNIFHEKTWVNFFADAKERATIYVHSKYNLKKESFFRKFEMETKVRTRWENTMNAQVELLKEALKDPANQKFIFVSETTIPLQDFDDVYARVMMHDKSIFKYKKNPYSYRNFRNIPGDHLYYNSQWVVLNRKHAELMVQDTTILNDMTHNPFDNEHYPSTFLVAAKKLKHEIEKKDLTMVIWTGGKHPHEFTNLTRDHFWAHLLGAINTKKYLFARKFNKHCDLSPLKELLPWVEMQEIERRKR